MRSAFRSLLAAIAVLAFGLSALAGSAPPPTIHAPPAPTLTPRVPATPHAPPPPLPAAAPRSTKIVLPREAPPPPSGMRDWQRAPAIIEHEAKGAIYAVSDLHGRYETSVRLLVGNKLIAGDPQKPSSFRWTGGDATLVVVGDLINKGDGSLKLIDMFRTLQASAQAAGGKVIVTMGNHEAGFLDDPSSPQAMRDARDREGRVGLTNELIASHLDPTKLAEGHDRKQRGAWLRNLPFAAKVGSYFFVHSGYTDGMTQEQLAAAIEKRVEHKGFGGKGIVGEESSPLGATNWKVTAAEAEKNAQRLGVQHIVMGHIPDALDGKGEIARSQNGALIKLDTGLGNDAEAPARILKIKENGKLRQRDESGDSRKVPRRG